MISPVSDCQYSSGITNVALTLWHKLSPILVEIVYLATASLYKIPDLWVLLKTEHLVILLDTNSYSNEIINMKIFNIIEIMSLFINFARFWFLTEKSKAIEFWNVYRFVQNPWETPLNKPRNANELQILLAFINLCTKGFGLKRHLNWFGSVIKWIIWEILHIEIENLTACR